MKRGLYRRGAWLALLLSFAFGGLFALSCPRCAEASVKACVQDGEKKVCAGTWRALSLKLQARIDNWKARGRRAIKKLATLRKQRDEARADAARSLSKLRNARDACGSKLAAKDLALAKVRKACLSRPNCTGWKIGFGASLALAGALGLILGIREATK